MFWGLIMEPNKRYTQVVEKPFHISQAALDSTTGDSTDACQVMVVIDGKNFLVCTLQKNKCLQVPLDLYFKSGDSVSFLTNGKSNIHLTGYLDPEFEDDVGEEEEDEDESDEAPALVEPSKKRKSEKTNDKNSAKKVKLEKKEIKTSPKDEEDSDDDEDKDHLQYLLDAEVDSDDNDDSKITSGDDSDEDEEDEDEEEEEDDDEEEEASDSEQADTTQDTSKEELDLSKIDTSKMSKSQKKRLKKKLAQQKQKPQVNGEDKPKDKKHDNQQKGDKAEKKGEKQNESAAVVKKEKKALSGGVTIEDLKVGSGPVAKPGKTVQVYYEGRLKQNNKMFDSCNKGNGFKFRLGSKEVISGWDVGVAGMKVGGKRKIVCPPPMAYGAKGSPPVIPPNSTLVFEVELKNVK